MKKTAALVLSALLLAGCSSTASKTSTSSNSSSTTASATSETTDAVSSASVTRSELSGDDLSKAYDELVSLSNDLATGKEASASDYKAPDSAIAEVLSTSSEGYPSMSTIHAWKVDKGAKTITVVMTDGTTIEGLINSGDKGTILIHGADTWYILHVTNAATKALEYSDEAYADGKGDFNMDYPVSEEKKTEYTVTFNIDEIESTAVYMFN